MSSFSDSDESEYEQTMKLDAERIVGELLPDKSKQIYLETYENFIQWRNHKGVKSISEPVLLCYFEELTKTKKSSSLWSIFSMLKATIDVKHNISIKKYTRLIAFLKTQSSNYQAKKSKVLSAENIQSFLEQAPDDQFLAIKVISILGINGACRCNELVNLNTDNMKKHSDTLLLVKLPDTKTKRERSFVVREDHVKTVEKYQSLRPIGMNTNRFLIQYRNGKCTRQPMGKNKISSTLMAIAAFLSLPDINFYTGHCFCRTSATLLADAGADLTRHGGWKSNTVAEGYLEDSLENKRKISARLCENVPTKTSAASVVDPWTPLLQLQMPQPSTSKCQINVVPPSTTNPKVEEEIPTNITASQVTTNFNKNSAPNITLNFQNWTNVTLSNVNIRL